MAQEPRTAQERAVLLLRALIPNWVPIPASGFQRLVWTIWIALGFGIWLLMFFAFDKPLWDWLDLLIVPAVLVIVGSLFTSSQNRAAQADAERRAQDDVIQDYLDRMRQLIDDDLRNERDTTDLRNLARGYTLSVLGRLDGRHKRNVIRVLYGAGLIYAHEPRVVILDEADLKRLV